MAMIPRYLLFLALTIVSAPTCASLFASCVIEGEVTSEGEIIKGSPYKQEFEIKIISAQHRPRSWHTDPDACPGAGATMTIGIARPRFARKLSYRAGDYIKFNWEVSDAGFGGGETIQVLTHKRVRR